MDPRQKARVPALSAFLVGFICTGGVAIAKPPSSNADDHRDASVKHDDKNAGATSNSHPQSSARHEDSTGKSEGKSGDRDRHDPAPPSTNDSAHRGPNSSPENVLDHNMKSPPSHGAANHHDATPATTTVPDTLVVLCHKPADGQGKTMAVVPSAVATHLSHGDTLGPCSGKSPGAIPHEPLPPLADADSDGVLDSLDQCPGTLAGQAVDVNGCSCSQRDADSDGVNDCKDKCPSTPMTEAADANGCSCSQRDADQDGVDDCDDQCANTPGGNAADANGCSCSQRDSDGDGVDDCIDDCSNTPAGEQANSVGCSCSQLDDDADGVNNCVDACPSTTPGEIVDANGCSVSIFTVDAGADRTAIEGDIVTVVASVHIVQGPFNADDLVYQWIEVGGVTAADVSEDGPTLAVDTTGVVGDLTYRLTIQSPDGQGSASDDMMITVYPARFVALAGGRYHNAAITENHFMQIWGSNRDGQFGDGSMNQDVESADAGESFTIASMNDGTAWTFGQSVLADSPAPVQVPGLSDVVQVSALLDGGILLRSSGEVWGFASADNRFCELAGATAIGTPGVAGPKPIPGLPTNIVRIVSAEYQTIALGSDGRAWVWGGQRFGCTPFVALDHVTDISAGEENLCLFVRDDGTAWGMGYNFYGQLGNGNTVSNYHTPTRVVGLTSVVAVAAGNHHSLFLKSDGTLYSAGWNHDCQLGLGSGFGVSTSAPQQVGLSNVRMIAGGYDHSVAVVGDQDVYIWGLNNIGQGSGATQTTLGSPVCVPTQVELPSP